MAFTPIKQDLNIISKLDDEPNDQQGLTPAQLKARFDTAGNTIKAYINDTLLPEMEQALQSIEADGFVPITRAVNGKALNEDIVLTAHDVGALPAETHVPTALSELNEDSMHRTVTDAEKAAWTEKSNLALGETEVTAYRGDRGKAAYEHSRTTGNAHNATPADIGAAAAAHGHGNLTSDGKIGYTANRAVYTGANGFLQADTLPVAAGGTGAATAEAALAHLGAVPAMRRINGKALTADVALTLDDVPSGSTNVAFTVAEKAKLGGLEPYTLPIATAGELGGIRVGAGLSIDANGILSATTESGDVPGDMVRAVYDPDEDGVVCAADYAYAVDWANVLNKPVIPAALSELNEDSMHRTVTDAEKSAWNLKSNLTLGETAETAYRGDRGKAAYNHSQTTGNAHSMTPADIGAAAAAHGHGNVTSDGKIGEAANRAVYTGTNGFLQAGTLPVAAGGTGATSASAALSTLGGVPTTRTVNGKPLSENVTLAAGDVGAVPTTRTVNGKALSADISLAASDVGAAASSHTHTKTDVGLGNVDNVKQMPIAGGAFTGVATAQSNTSYTTAQIRNIVLSTGSPSGGSNGDVWIKYT